MRNKIISKTLESKSALKIFTVGFMMCIYPLLSQNISQECKMVQTDETSFFSYIRKGDLTGVSCSLKDGVYIEARAEVGRTPLILASYFGQLEIVKLLLLHGANINARDGTNRTAFMQALWNKHNAVASYLISKGASAKPY